MIGRIPVHREISLRTREALHGYGFILIWIVGFSLFTFLSLVETFRYSLNQVTVTATHISLDFCRVGKLHPRSVFRSQLHRTADRLYR